jgi:MFS family permease
MGILSFASEKIEHDLKITEGQMGLLETGMYIGIVSGSIIMPFLFKILSPKWLIVAATILNATAVSVFSLIENFWLIFASRIAVGLFLSVFIIFFPVWIDQCAPQKSQAMWISLYFLTEDLGIVIGYGVALLFIKYLKSWRWSFCA